MNSKLKDFINIFTSFYWRVTDFEATSLKKYKTQGNARFKEKFFFFP